MPQLYQVLKIKGLEKIKNPEILSQFVRADQQILDGVSEAPITLAQALRNAIREQK